MKGWQALPVERCGNCKYFRRHYGHVGGERYFAMGYDHCVHPRLKKRRAEEHCACWTAPDEEAPAVTDCGGEV